MNIEKKNNIIFVVSIIFLSLLIILPIIFIVNTYEKKINVSNEIIEIYNRSYDKQNFEKEVTKLIYDKCSTIPKFGYLNNSVLVEYTIKNTRISDNIKCEGRVFKVKFIL